MSKIYRFNVGTLMIVIAALASWLALLQTPGGIFLAIILPGLILEGAFFWWWAKHQARLAARTFGVLAFADNLGVAALCIYNPSWDLERFFGALVSIVAAPAVLGCGAAWAYAATRPHMPYWHSRLLIWPLVVGLGVAPPTMLFTNWPFRLAFLMSRPALDRLANRVRSGQAPHGPVWAGPFRVLSTSFDQRTSNVRLTIGDDSLRRPTFVQTGPATPPKYRKQGWESLVFEAHLSDRWWYLEEDLFD